MAWCGRVSVVTSRATSSGMASSIRSSEVKVWGRSPSSASAVAARAPMFPSSRSHRAARRKAGIPGTSPATAASSFTPNMWRVPMPPHPTMARSSFSIAVPAPFSAGHYTPTFPPRGARRKPPP